MGREDMLHAACSVVEKDRLDLGVAAEEVAALIKRHRMGENPALGAELYSWGSNKVMGDAQMEFGLDKYVAIDQQIGMLGHGSGERVLDRNYCSLDRSALHAVKHLGRARAWDDRTAGHHALRCFVAEGPEFALDGNFHDWQVIWRGPERANTFSLFCQPKIFAPCVLPRAEPLVNCSQFLPQHQGVDAIRIITRPSLDHGIAMALVERKGRNVVDGSLQGDGSRSHGEQAVLG